MMWTIFGIIRRDDARPRPSGPWPKAEGPMDLSSV